MQKRSETPSNDLPSIRSELSARAVRYDQASCSDCGGQLWRDGNDVVCERCSAVYGSLNEVPRIHLNGRVVEHHSTYRNSGKIRCPGGFPHVYEWKHSDDVESTIDELDPEIFYG